MILLVVTSLKITTSYKFFHWKFSSTQIAWKLRRTSLLQSHFFHVMKCLFSVKIMTFKNGCKEDLSRTCWRSKIDCNETFCYFLYVFLLNKKVELNLVFINMTQPHVNITIPLNHSIQCLWNFLKMCVTNKWTDTQVQKVWLKLNNKTRKSLQAWLPCTHPVP